MVVNRATAPFGEAGKVVANGRVGLGVPLTVTVGRPRTGEGGAEEGVDDAARTVNWLDVAYMTPIVELMKRRK